MKKLLTSRQTPLALLLAGIWACAQAQSLGTPVADVLLGRPLDMTVPARFNGGDDNECVHADVFYGETRLSPNAITTTLTGPVDRRSVRIEATTPINEPIVTVSLRAGCRGTITRNYTLLPEYPSEGLLAAVDARAAMAAATPAVPLKLARETTPSTSPRKARAPSVVVARATAEAAPAHTRASTSHGPRKPSFKGPRLKLEPIDLPEQEQGLRASTSLADANGDPARRATAALLWQAINADPQEVMRTTVMIHKLEDDLAALRLSSAQTRNEVAALRRRLDAVQPWYLRPGIVQLLALMVLAAAGAAGALWWRLRKLQVAPSGPWYAPSEREEPVLAAEAAVDVDVAAPVVQPQAPVAIPQPVREPVREPLVARADAAGPIDFDLHETPAEAAAPVARASADGVLRVEALAATFEEVEFLCSLGLTPDAMDILKGYLQDSSRPAPIAYLELMRLCEQCEDPAALATVRRRYVQSFGVEAPRLAQFTADGGVDSMPALSARITRTWGTPEALAVIEEALFEVPTPGAPLTLQTGRDLVVLYELALARAAEMGAADSEAPLAPWAHAEDAHAAETMAQGAADADGGRQFALDVDLSAPEATPLPETQPMPDLELVPLLAKMQADSARAQPAPPAQEEEDAFSAAMASERMPVSRY